MGKGKQKRRFGFGQYLTLALLLYVLILIACSIYSGSDNWRRQKRLTKSPPIPESITPQSAEPVAPPTVNQEMDAPIADRRQVAHIIIEALNAYYADHQEYPPFLLGGYNEEYPYFEGQYPDPLVAEGYITNYPRICPSPEYWFCASGFWIIDLRSAERWLCMFATPGDHEITGNGLKFPDYPILDRADPGPIQDRPTIPLSLTTLGSNDRQYAVGGRSLGFSLDPLRTHYSFWPGEFFNRANVGGGCGTNSYTKMTFFGYQRGEWLNKDKTEAWLWFYGTNIFGANSYYSLIEAKGGLNIQPVDGVSKSGFGDLWRVAHKFCYQPPQGLDLVNAITGEPVPDGIPDGICLQYILRDGELVESIAAPGLN